jgi:hypothetical protein
MHRPQLPISVELGRGREIQLSKIESSKPMLHHYQFLNEKLFMFLNKQSSQPLLHQYQFLKQ